MKQPLNLALLRSSGSLVIETRPSLLRRLVRAVAEFCHKHYGGLK